ncbi:MAG TPA: hypothetical protein VFV67_14500, partial [Actinophytocola sp.]|uniref:hypothetical protein n=1 Tax=Actinophytocola sp. TaxID=1872138 RepID=UPI002DB840CE
MTSFLHRYTRGDHESVWRELRALGPVPPRLRADVTAVADATMQRVARHIARITAALPHLGFIPEATLPLHRPPTPTDHTELDTLTHEIGPLPAALASCLRHIGAVSLLGDWPPSTSTTTLPLPAPRTPHTPTPSTSPTP